MKSPRGAAKLLVAFLVALAEGAACSVRYPSIAAGPSFQVRVNDRGRPVDGLAITLRGRTSTTTVTTGKDGTAHFRSLEPGAYEVRAEFDAGIGDAAIINVSATGPAEIAVPLRWPRQTPLSLRALRGTIRWPFDQPPIQGERQTGRLQVELLDAHTRKSLSSTQTTGDGAFQLGTPTPGLYFLRVAPIDPALTGANRSAAFVPVEVDERAVHPEMELQFAFTSCGFVYGAIHTCPRPELNLSSLRGQVVYVTGAPVERATVRLVRGDGEIAEELISDEKGQFVSQKTFDGSSQLVVIAPGLTILRQSVVATRPEDGGRPSALRIELGMGGACSQAVVR